MVVDSKVAVVSWTCPSVISEAKLPGAVVTLVEVVRLEVGETLVMMVSGEVVAVVSWI